MDHFTYPEPAGPDASEGKGVLHDPHTKMATTRIARRTKVSTEICMGVFWIFRFETFTDEENNFQRKVKVRYGRGILRFVGKQGRGKRSSTLRPERKNTKGTNCFTTACPHTNSHVKKIRVYSCRLIV
ncbi:MAG: hypothetical protein ACLT68_12015 [Phocaeicola coprophilus]|uniref:hypothetical protein n=1 Tax=Phocaeicola coprophilus TaxID=387090 RepID=UPI003995562E